MSHFCRAQPAVRLAELHDAGSRSRMDLLGSPLAPYRRMEHLVHRQQELIAQLTEQHETAASLEEAQARVAHAEAQLKALQAEVAEARARLARVAWRERIHNKIAELMRGLRTH